MASHASDLVRVLQGASIVLRHVVRDGVRLQLWETACPPLNHPGLTTAPVTVYRADAGSGGHQRTSNCFFPRGGRRKTGRGRRPGDGIRPRQLLPPSRLGSIWCARPTRPSAQSLTVGVLAPSSCHSECGNRRVRAIRVGMECSRLRGRAPGPTGIEQLCRPARRRRCIKCIRCGRSFRHITLASPARAGPCDQPRALLVGPCHGRRRVSPSPRAVWRPQGRRFSRFFCPRAQYSHGPVTRAGRPRFPSLPSLRLRLPGACPSSQSRATGSA